MKYCVGVAWLCGSDVRVLLVCGNRCMRMMHCNIIATSYCHIMCMYRDVRASAIPGGSEEILLDFAMRQVVAKAKL